MIKININDVFGDYKILSRNTTKQAAAIYWDCECVFCHKQKTIRADAIRKNPKCKCQYQPLKNFISNEFIVLEKTDKIAPDKCNIYKCQCQKCGNIEYIASNVLRSRKKHCSNCYQKHTTLIDLTGETFGWLKVLERDLSKDHIGKGKDSYWICECQNCGTILSIRGFSLRNGLTKSCGCIKSRGEMIISQILTENNISFQREYSFPDLIYKLPLRFDFAIFNNDGTLSHLVEYDGSQHYMYRNSGWNTKENFEKTKIRDQIKNEYCFEKNIKLIRIKYNEDITLEKILGENKNGFNSKSNEGA